MRKITANYIYTPDSGFLKFGIIVLDDDARIQDIIDTKGSIKEMQGLEFYSGLVSVGRIEKEEFLRYTEVVEIEVVLRKILSGREPKGLTIFNDLDLANFLIKPTTTIKILV